MVFENDPFEDFKRKRQVRELESTFRHDAEKRHEHLENLVRSSQDSSELADRVELEMETSSPTARRKFLVSFATTIIPIRG